MFLFHNSAARFECDVIVTGVAMKRCGPTSPFQHEIAHVIKDMKANREAEEVLSLSVNNNKISLKMSGEVEFRLDFEQTMDLQ